MQYRTFGKTDLKLSAVGFGSWAIGGQSFGQVTKSDALAALSKAKELGCNFVDTAAVYGAAESILGEYLNGQRQDWIIATKYSSKRESVEATLEAQLQRLNTDYIDFYQIHWAPSEPELYETLERLKESGKVRYIGVSLKSVSDIDYVIHKTNIDGIQVPISLLDPLPFFARCSAIANKGLGVIARSSLHYGFLTGNYQQATQFTDENDQRYKWSAEKIKTVQQQVEGFLSLADSSRSLTSIAASYPLAFPEVTTVIMSAKNEKQAAENFSNVENKQLTPELLAAIKQCQTDLGLFSVPLKSRVKSAVSNLRYRVLNN